MRRDYSQLRWPDEPNADGAEMRSVLEEAASTLRRLSIESTSNAGSGHPTSCLSCAELIAALFFGGILEFDVGNPSRPSNDRFVLSKGHAAPILWGAWAEAGAFDPERVRDELRRAGSDLEGHPTPRNPWVDAATGSLGQGLSIGLGLALGSRFRGSPGRVYVLMGDGELSEGAVWEAAAWAGHEGMDRLVALVDANRLGQSGPSPLGHDLYAYRDRFRAFGWHVEIVEEGHDVLAVLAALRGCLGEKERPSAVIARTFKGKGVTFLEDELGRHGKPLDGDERESALRELGTEGTGHVPPAFRPANRRGEDSGPGVEVESEPGTGLDIGAQDKVDLSPPSYYGKDEPVSLRKALGTALAKLGALDPRVVVLDGDVKNSTYTGEFERSHPERFIQCHIAEQNMIGMATGLAATGRKPFASSFACFLTRAFDQIRMASVSGLDLKLCGSHGGVSVGEDGPSQMGLEDVALMRAVHGSTVLSPSDAVATEWSVQIAAQTGGIVYVRTCRPALPVLYGPEQEFRRGGSVVLRSSPEDRATIVGTGITVHEALEAYESLHRAGLRVRVIDAYCLKPLDEDTLLRAARETGSVLTVEDHRAEGGLGEAVAGVLAGERISFTRLAITTMPSSAPGPSLLRSHCVDARSIERAARALIARGIGRKETPS
jgi:transketolase